MSKRIRTLSLLPLLIISLFFINPCFAEGETNISPSPPPILYKIQIISPEDEETFQNEAQNLTVTVNVIPALKSGDTVAILVDGELMVEPSETTSITVPWLPRGSHSLQAIVTPKKGIKAVSQTITIYQQRTSAILNNRNRP